MTDLNRELKMVEIEKIRAETTRLQAETVRLQAEADKIQKETKLYPYVVAGGLGGLVGAILSLVIKAL